MSFEFMETVNRHLDEKRYEQCEDKKGIHPVTLMGIFGWILFVWYLLK